MGFLDTLGNAAKGLGSAALNIGTLGGYGAGQSADAQQAIAEQQLAQQQQERQLALGFATATPNELEAQANQLNIAHTAYSNAESQLSQYSAMMSQMSPIFSQSMSQVSMALNGQNPAFMNPYLQTIKNSQTQLNNSNLASMGSGGNNSSAGIQSNALNNYQSGLMSNQVVGSLMGIATQAGQGIESLGQAGQAGLVNAGAINTNYASMLGNVQNRQIAASEHTSTTPYQGADQAGNLVMGSWGQSTATNIINAAAGIASSKKAQG